MGDFIFTVVGLGCIIAFVLIFAFGMRTQKSLLRSNQFIIRVVFDPIRYHYRADVYARNIFGRLAGCTDFNEINDAYNISDSVANAVKQSEQKLRRLLNDQKKPVHVFIDR